MQSSYDVHRYANAISFSQELFKLTNRDFYADRCDDQISFFFTSVRNPSNHCFILT